MSPVCFQSMELRLWNQRGVALSNVQGYVYTTGKCEPCLTFSRQSEQPQLTKLSAPDVQSFENVSTDGVVHYQVRKQCAAIRRLHSSSSAYVGRNWGRGLFTQTSDCGRI